MLVDWTTSKISINIDNLPMSNAAVFPTIEIPIEKFNSYMIYEELQGTGNTESYMGPGRNNCVCVKMAQQYWRLPALALKILQGYIP
jgi:hypothetical protein